MALSTGSRILHELIVGVRERAVLDCRDLALDEGSTRWGGTVPRSWVRERYEDGDPYVRRAMDARLIEYALDPEPLLDLGEPFLESAIGMSSMIRPEVRLEDVGTLGRALDAPTDRFVELALGERGARSADEVEIVRTLGRWLARRYEDGDPEVRRAMGLALARESLISLGLGGISLERPLHAQVLRKLSGYVVPTDGDAPHGWDEAWNGGGHVLGTLGPKGSALEVTLYDRGGPAEPHVHIRRPRSPRTPDVCLSLVRPAYVPHGNKTRGLGPVEAEELVAYLEAPDGGRGSGRCRWRSLLDEWDYYRGEDHADTPMPDYGELSPRHGERPDV